MRLDAALLASNGKENLRDAMTDIVSDNVFDEKHRQPNANDGIDEIEPVGASLRESVRQQALNLPDKPLQKQAGKRSENADQQTDEQHKPTLGEVSATPTNEIGYEISIIQNL